MIRWISTDVATSSGAVIWEDTTPRWALRIWPNAKKTVWRLKLWEVVLEGESPCLLEPEVRKYDTDQAAWEAVWSLTYGGYEHFVAEAVYGDAADVLAERRGTILVWLDCRRKDVVCWKARASEWRAAVVYGTNRTWPQGRKAKKAFSVLLVEEELGEVLPDDVADAYLIGKWFLLKEAYEARDRTATAKRVRRAGRPKRGRGNVRKRGRVV